MTNTTIAVTARDHGVFTVTLNRPDRGNAFDGTMLAALSAAFASFSGNPAVRVVILRANGRHFCTGADIAGSREGAEAGPGLNEVLAQIDRLDKPVVGVIHGGCLGGGIGFAACCDAVIALEGAYFSIPELRVGIAPSSHFTGLLVRTIGTGMLRRYGLTGERMQAEAALAAGLVHEIVSAEALDARLDALIRAILENAPGASAAFKQTIAGYARPTSEQLFPEVGTPRRGLERSAEAVEGLAAFREKRKPAWVPR